jgi:putative transposase
MYRINRLLNIRDTKDKSKKKRRKKGIRAKTPNQIWHADITTLKTLDKKRYYIYLLIDNFSRCILSYEIRERVSGIVTAKTIYDAYNKALDVDKELNVKLIVDGGPENNNVNVDGFINQSRINIKKLVALRDIEKSNSMIEALNKTLKYHYIFPKHPRDLKHLKRTLRFFIEDYNTKRPHGALNGLTPIEAWKGKQPPNDLRTTLLKQARLDRIAYSRENRCGKC